MKTILYNARIHTMDQAQPMAEALAIQDGKILAMGTNEDILALADRHSSAENMAGASVLPGFSDSHIHLNYFAKSLTVVDCETATKEECLQRVREKVSHMPAGAWVIGHGWNQNKWGGSYGTLDDLDEISRQHPIFLTAKSLHASWVNSVALERAKIDISSANPQGGLIGRDSDGKLNGLLFENAAGLIENAIPSAGIDQIAAGLEIAQKELWRYGFTSIHDFDGMDCYSALQKLKEEQKLKIRVLKSIPFAHRDQAIQNGLITGAGTDYLRIGSLKIFSDGALGPQTAAMISPYETAADNRGVLMLTADEFFEHGKIAVQAGISLAVHAIGDRANLEMLRGMRALRAYEHENKLPVLPHRIEHAQLLTGELPAEFAKLGIIASVQPIHLISDMDTADRHWGARSRYAYAFRSLLDTGVQIVFGSDSPVESPNPFLGIYSATCRQKTDGYPQPYVWYPEQKISLREALYAYTRAPALLAGWRNVKGQIHPGEEADLIVLLQDIFNISLPSIKDLLPTATMVAGEWVWRQ